MDFIELIIKCILGVLVIILCVLLHELGHALFGLIFSKENVDVVLGDGNQVFKVSIGRLTVYFNGYSSFMALSKGHAYCFNINSKLGRILVCLGGPLVSLICCIGVYTTLILYHNNFSSITNFILNLSFNYTLMQFLVTIIPMKYNYFPYKGHSSDGYHIKSILLNKGV